MDNRLQRRLARRQQMIDTAMAIVLEDGLENLTIARLAKRLDAAVGALYRYFPGKEALLVGVEIQAIGLLHDYMRERLERVDAALSSQLPPGVRSLTLTIASFFGYLEHATHAPRLHALVDSFVSSPAMLLDDEQARVVGEAIVPLFEMISGHLDAAAEAGTLSPGDATVRIHLGWAAFHGLDHFRKRDRIQPRPLQVAQLKRKLVASLLVGWGASADDLKLAMESFDAARLRLATQSGDASA